MLADGSAKRQVQQAIRGEILQSKQIHHQGDQHQTAAYAEQPGEEADEQAHQQIDDPPFHRANSPTEAS